MKLIFFFIIVITVTNIKSQTTLCPGQTINHDDPNSNWRYRFVDPAGVENTGSINESYNNLVSSYLYRNPNANYYIATIYHEHWTIWNGWKVVNTISYRLDFPVVKKIIPDTICESLILNYPNMIDYPMNGVFTFSQGNSVSYQNTNNYYNIISNSSGILNGGGTITNVTFSYNYKGCSHSISKQGIPLEYNPTISINSNLPDSIIQGQSVVLNSHIIHNGDSILSYSRGVIKQSSNLVFNSNYTDTGWVHFCVDVYKNTCTNNTCDSIYVKYNPGTPYPPVIVSESKKDTVVYFSPGTGSTVLNSHSFNGQLYQPEYRSYVCQGNNYTYKVINPQVNQPNPSNDLTYHWYVQNNSNLTFLGSDTIINYTIPVNSSTDSILLICKAKNSINQYGTPTILKLITQSKPNLFLSDTICYYYIDTNIIKTYVPNYFVYPTLMDSLMLRESITRNIYINGTLTPGIDTLALNNSPLTKTKNIRLETIITAPYKGNYDTITSNSIIVPVTFVYYIKNNCDCSFNDTILYVQRPIPSFNYAGLDTVPVNYRIDITNNSLFYDSAIWTSTMDAQVWHQDNFSQYTRVWGNHDFNIELYDNYGCDTYTTLIDLFYCDNPADSVRLANIEENKEISFFSLYPNPTSDIININFTSQESENIELYVLDLQGRIIKTTPFKIEFGGNHFNLDLSTITPGTYILLFKGVNINGYYKIKKI